MKTETISAEKLDALKNEWKEPKLAAWYYMGTKDGYHYFHFYDIDGDKRYRVNANEFEMKNTISFWNNQEKWILMRWGPHAIIGN